MRYIMSTIFAFLIVCAAAVSSNAQNPIHVIGYSHGLSYGIYGSTGSFTGWESLSRRFTIPGYITGTSTAQIGTELHLLAQVMETSDSTVSSLYHCIRRADGTWTPLARIPTAVGLKVRAAGIANVNGSLHVVASIYPSRYMHHAIRYSNGGWTTFNLIGSATVAPNIKQIAIAGISDQMHMIGVDDNNAIWHAVRFGNGGWTATGYVYSQTGIPQTGQINSVTAAGLNGELHVLFSNTSTYYHSLRRTNGTWTAFGNVEGQVGDKGQVWSVSASPRSGKLAVVILNWKSSLQTYLTHRSPTSWSAYVPVGPSIGIGGVSIASR